MVFFKSVFFCFTIWVATALLNGLLSGSLLFFTSAEFTYWPESLLVVIAFTMVFSIPGMFFFWIVLLVKRNEALLFRSLLRVALLISSLSSMVLFIIPAFTVRGQQVWLSLFTIVATIASVMMHHRPIKAITNHTNHHE